MARPDKVAAVADVKDRFDASAAMLLTNYRGLSVKELQDLRAELRKSSATYRVSKNTLIRRAMADVGVEGLDDVLVGPTALVFCEEDPVGPAKAIKAFLKDHPALELKGAWFDGEVMDADTALRLADLESREDLLTNLAGLMYGALANTARLLQALPEQQARLMQALVDDGGWAGAPADAAAVAPEVGSDEPEAAADESPAQESPADAEATASPADESVEAEPVAEPEVADTEPEADAVEAASDVPEAAAAPAQDEPTGA